MAVLVRDSHDADVAAIRAIYADAVLTDVASWEWAPPATAELARRRAATLSRGFPYLVAEWDGEVAGYAYADQFRARAAYDWSCENSVYVDPRQKGRGMGRALMDELLRRCTELGYRQMLAVIGLTPDCASVGFHAAMGFVEVGRVQNFGWKNECWRDLVLMQRSLGEGGNTPPEIL